MSETLEIRTMTLPELELALEWAALEGWNPGLEDAESFYAADPEGFFLALWQGEPVGCLSAVAYPDGFGFLGLYLVRPAFRGRGWGMQLWRHGLQSLAQSHEHGVIGLDGVQAQQENYRKSGFEWAYENLRFEFTPQALQKLDGSRSEIAVRQTVRPLADTPEELQNVLAFDARCFPSRRRPFLEVWLTRPSTKTASCWAGDTLTGFAAIRPCRVGYKIGPLFAENREIAATLLQELCAPLPDKTPIYLDVPAVNSAAMALAEQAEMHKVFGTARMYRGPAPTVDLSQVFGVTTFELG